MHRKFSSLPIILCSCAATMFFGAYIAYPSLVYGPSMLPTFKMLDLAIVYHGDKFLVGDVVAAKIPTSTGYIVVFKRIAAIDGGSVMVGGMRYSTHKGSAFLIGDNLEKSMDSRSCFGRSPCVNDLQRVVPISDLIGIVTPVFGKSK